MVRLHDKWPIGNETSKMGPLVAIVQAVNRDDWFDAKVTANMESSPRELRHSASPFVNGPFMLPIMRTVMSLW